jgi:uncharacterized protein YqgQ
MKLIRVILLSICALVVFDWQKAWCSHQKYGFLTFFGQKSTTDKLMADCLQMMCNFQMMPKTTKHKDSEHKIEHQTRNSKNKTELRVRHKDPERMVVIARGDSSKDKPSKSRDAIEKRQKKNLN